MDEILNDTRHVAAIYFDASLLADRVTGNLIQSYGIASFTSQMTLIHHSSFIGSIMYEKQTAIMPLELGGFNMYDIGIFHYNENQKW